MRANVLPALLNKILAALQDLIQHGINYSPTNETLEKVRMANSHLLQFVHDTEMDYSKNAEIDVSDLWTQLEGWYISTGILTIDDKGKRTWAELTTPGDTLIKGSHLVARRFVEMFPQIKTETRSRKTPSGSNKTVTVLRGIGMPQPDPNPPENIPQNLEECSVELEANHDLLSSPETLSAGEAIDAKIRVFSPGEKCRYFGKTGKDVNGVLIGVENEITIFTVLEIQGNTAIVGGARGKNFKINMSDLRELDHAK
jgi:hypothetical protein